MLTVYRFSTSESSPKASNIIKSLLDMYAFPLYVAASIGAFGYLRKTKNNHVPILDTVATELDKCSLGIYLIHMAIDRYVFLVLKFNPFEHGGTIAVIGVCIVTLAVSYVITRLLKLVPGVKKIV